MDFFLPFCSNLQKLIKHFSPFRNDDREILLECQKKGPSLKTFTHLAAKLNKNPYQVTTQILHLYCFTDGTILNTWILFLMCLK